MSCILNKQFCCPSIIGPTGPKGERGQQGPPGTPGNRNLSNAFYAYKSTSTFTGNVIFDIERYDTHNNYDPTTGLYTIPQTGLYEFSYNLIVQSGGLSVAELTSALRINGSTSLYLGIAKFNITNSISQIVTFSATVIYPFDAGTEVGVYIGAGGPIVREFSYFTGKRVD